MNSIYVLDLIGTLVFAISGVLAGVDKKFDLMGVLILGLVTAVGGGTLRDILIGQTPVGWMNDLNYVYIIFAALPLAYIFKTHILRFRRGMFLFDTIGIGLFTIAGLQKTLNSGLSPVIALLMGVVSASFGGVIRDVLSNQVPLIFRREIYATACLLGGSTYLGLEYFQPEGQYNMILSVIVVMVIRYLAVRYKWSLNFEERDA
ncbi:MAG: trimeric intracellular cation channel family protein [Bacteroidota bacterium]